MIDSCEHRQQRQQQQQQQQQRQQASQYQASHPHNHHDHHHHQHHCHYHHRPHANCSRHASEHRSSKLIDAQQSKRITHPHTIRLHIVAIVVLAIKQISLAYQTIGKHRNIHVATTNQCRWMPPPKDSVNIDNGTKLLPTVAVAPFLMSLLANVGQITYNARRIDTMARLRPSADGPTANDRRGGVRIARGGSSKRSAKHALLMLTTMLMCLPIWLCQASSVQHNLKYSANTVKTKYGELRGLVVRNNPTVEAYLGVPYATPPTGSLRYMPPVTPSAWKSTRLADHFGSVCPQIAPVSPTDQDELHDIPVERVAQIRRLLPLLANQSEDCLYLNLYVPRTDGTHGESLATIVYIHGESYEWNSGNPYDGSILAAHGNVIVVTINFRLGVLGFLKTGTKGSAQGNFGLMDLVAGLHWLRENLPAFNGDATKITLMGHGTGASLVNILMASPVASDLVRRGILLSGSALSPWGIQRDPLYIKRKVAEQTGCHGDLIEDDLAPCLRTKSLKDLLAVRIETPRFSPSFAPFVDGTVIVGLDADVNKTMNLPIGSALSTTMGLAMADFKDREILFGVTSLESYLDLSAHDLEFGFNETHRDRILRTYVRNNFYYHLNEIYAALKNEYTDWEKPPRNPIGSRDVALELLSDGHTVAPLIRISYMHSLRGGRSFFVHFKHRSTDRGFSQRSGSIHGEDIPFWLGLPVSPIFPQNYTNDDIKISRMLVRYLASFAHNGNPNETPPSVQHISQMQHNHIGASAHELARKAQFMTADQTVKQKRQLAWFNNHRRNRRSHRSSYIDSDEESAESDEPNSEYDETESDEQSYNQNRDRLDDISDTHYPFWDTYDALNQYYLEIGSRAQVKNHYRGHKLSLWLNLIPQLHMPGDLSELSMRHHHFPESDAKFYDGIVREQTYDRPIIVRTTKIDVKVVPTRPSTVKVPLTTECPLNVTVQPTLASAKSHHNITHIKADPKANNLDSFLRHLTNSQFQSYSAALAVTIGVGCFLLLLNVLIFIGIYYQRVKRTLDAKRKEEFADSEMRMPSFLNRCLEKNGEKMAIDMAPYQSNETYSEYDHYIDKMLHNEQHLFANICGAETSMEYKCKLSEHLQQSVGPLANIELQEKSTHVPMKSVPLHVHGQQQQQQFVQMEPSGSSSSAGSSSCAASDLVTYQQCQKHPDSVQQTPVRSHAELCSRSTQSDDMDAVEAKVQPTQVMATAATMNPTTTAASGGILRQPIGPNTPSTSKKRVQIQEISV